MSTLYLLFKFVHLTAAIVWLGGVAALYTINLQLSRSRDPAVLGMLSSLGIFYGRSVIGPAAGVTLIAGIVTVLLGSLAFSMLWISWGFAAVILSLVLGASFIRITTTRLANAAQASTSDAGRISTLQARLSLLNILNLLILLSAVWAMVFKPVL